MIHVEALEKRIQLSVTAVSPAGTVTGSGWTTALNISRSSMRVKAPTSLKAIIRNGSVTLTWKGSASVYYIHRFLNGVDVEFLGTTSAHFFTDSAVDPNLGYTYFVSADPNWAQYDPPSVDAPSFLGDLRLDPVLPYTIAPRPKSPDEGGVVTVRFVTHLTRPLTGDNFSVDWSDNSFTTPGREPSQFGTYPTADPTTMGIWASHIYAQGGSYRVEADLFDNTGEGRSTVKLLISGLKGSPPVIVQPARAIFQSRSRIDLTIGARSPGGAPLIYNWSVVRWPGTGAASVFDDNNDETASNTSATVNRAGDYRFKVVVSTIGSILSSSEVLVHVKPYAAFTRVQRTYAGNT